MNKSAIKFGSAIVLKILAHSIPMKLISLLKENSFHDNRLMDSLISLIPREESVLIGKIGDSSFYFNPNKATSHEKKLIIDAFEKMKIDPDKLDTIESYMMNSLINNKKLIIASPSDGVVALAHEIGHLIEDLKGWTKVLQSRPITSMSSNGMAPSLISVILSILGKDAYSVIVPLLIQSPTLITEFMASKIGLDLLKKAGASDSQMEKCRRSLRYAWSTYLSQAFGVSLNGVISGTLIKGFSDDTYIIKRKRYAAVRNPYKERVAEVYNQSEEIAEDNGTTEVDENLSKYQPKSNESAERIKNKLGKNETPIYQNLSRNTKVDNINKSLDKDRNRLKNKTVNQNINITRNTNINNPSKEKAAELDAQVKMAKLQQKQSQSGGVNEKLIEIQKTNPLKPLGMN